MKTKKAWNIKAAPKPPTLEHINPVFIECAGRHRKDMGDIRALADSINALGLLQPIVVRELPGGRYQLIAGGRRLLAAGLLEWARIPAYVVHRLEDAATILQAERDENTCRKPFTPSEAVALGKSLEQEEREAAERRQKTGGKPAPSGKFPEGHTGQTRDKVGEAVGMSGKTYAKAKAVVEAAEQDAEAFGDLPDVMDQDGKVDQAFQEMRRRRKRQEMAQRAAVAPSLDTNACRVLHGDNLAEMLNLDAAGERFRLIFTDPQYNQGEDYGDGPQADQFPERDYLEQQRQRLEVASRLLTSDGSLWVLIDVFHSADFVFMLRELGLYQRASITWYETFGVCNSAQTNFSRTSRHLLYFVKDPQRFVFNPEAVTCRSARQELGDKRANPWGKVFDDVWTIPRLFGTSTERIPDFPTQLPLDLLRPLVGCATHPGDAVLDFNSGSATTGVACLELGRRFVGIEKRARFVKLSTDRLKCLTK